MIGLVPCLQMKVKVKRYVTGVVGVVVAVMVIGLIATGLLIRGSASSPPAPGLPATLSAPAGTLPDAVYRAGPETIAAYQAAVSDPDVLASVPCLCGCEESLGHSNNLDCYITGTKPGGVVIYATHGIDCGVCQQITKIAMNGAREGLDGPELRQLVLDHYGK
jgi:hypothetical protein